MLILYAFCLKNYLEYYYYRSILTLMLINFKRLKTCKQLLKQVYKLHIKALKYFTRGIINNLRCTYSIRLLNKYKKTQTQTLKQGISS